MKNFAKGCSVRTIRSFGNFEINPLRLPNSFYNNSLLQKKILLFRVKNKEDHSEGCSFYEELISNEEVIRLIESKKEVDEERLKFLIEMNMRNALNLLRKQNNESLISKQEINNNSKKSINNKNRTQEVNTMKRVHISNLLKKQV